MGRQDTIDTRESIVRCPIISCIIAIFISLPFDIQGCQHLRSDRLETKEKTKRPGRFHLNLTCQLRRNLRTPDIVRDSTHPHTAAAARSMYSSDHSIAADHNTHHLNSHPKDDIEDQNILFAVVRVLLERNQQNIVVDNDHKNSSFGAMVPVECTRHQDILDALVKHSEILDDLVVAVDNHGDVEEHRDGARSVGDGDVVGNLDDDSDHFFDLFDPMVPLSRLVDLFQTFPLLEILSLISVLSAQDTPSGAHSSTVVVFCLVCHCRCDFELSFLVSRSRNMAEVCLDLHILDTLAIIEIQ
jgi:hypothetical protein